MSYVMRMRVLGTDTVSPPRCPEHDGDTRIQVGATCLGQSLARHAAMIDDPGEYHYAARPFEIEALTDRQRAMLATFHDLTLAASNVLEQLANELCPEAGEYQW